MSVKIKQNWNFVARAEIFFRWYFAGVCKTSNPPEILTEKQNMYNKNQVKVIKKKNKNNKNN